MPTERRSIQQSLLFSSGRHSILETRTRMASKDRLFSRGGNEFDLLTKSKLVIISSSILLLLEILVIIPSHSFMYSSHSFTVFHFVSFLPRTYSSRASLSR